MVFNGPNAAINAIYSTLPLYRILDGEFGFIVLIDPAVLVRLSLDQALQEIVPRF